MFLKMGGNVIHGYIFTGIISFLYQGKRGTPVQEYATEKEKICRFNIMRGSKVLNWRTWQGYYMKKKGSIRSIITWEAVSVNKLLKLSHTW